MHSFQAPYFKLTMPRLSQTEQNCFTRLSLVCKKKKNKAKPTLLGGQDRDFWVRNLPYCTFNVFLLKHSVLLLSRQIFLLLLFLVSF